MVLEEFKKKHAGSLAAIKTSLIEMPLAVTPVIAGLAFYPYSPLEAISLASAGIYTIPAAASEAIIRKWDIERAKKLEEEVV